jgi:hypothetical protein
MTTFDMSLNIPRSLGTGLRLSEVRRLMALGVRGVPRIDGVALPQKGRNFGCAKIVGGYWATSDPKVRALPQGI